MLLAVVRFESKRPEPFFTTSPVSPRSFFSIHFVTISAASWLFAGRGFASAAIDLKIISA